MGNKSKKTNMIKMLLILAAVIFSTASFAIGADEVEVSGNQTLQILTFERFHKNIVPSANVEGVVTFTKLYDVTFHEALDAILGHAYVWEEDGGFVKVYTTEEYQQIRNDQSRMVQRVFTLYYVNAAEMQKMITPALSESAEVAASSAAALDTVPGKGGDTLSGRDMLIVSDFPENIEEVEKIVNQLDVKPPQILIDVTILEARLTEQTKFGIDFDSLDSAVTAIGGEGASMSGFATSGNVGLNIGIVQDHVRVFIRALEEITDTTVLANPKILALNKQAGKLLIGSEDGYLTLTNVNADAQTQEVDFLETGTKLEFRPFVCADGLIRMEIYPEQSTGSVDQTSGLPSKTTTTVQTNIMVKDGKTIVIGGLFKEETTLTRKQVPLVGDIPYIGEAFRGTDDKSERRELIILITPHIIQDPEQTNGADRLEDISRITNKARKNIHWLNRARRAEDNYSKALEYYSDGELDKALSHLNSSFEGDRTDLTIERLKERIVTESQPDSTDQIERIMLDVIEREESEKWYRN